MLKYTLLFRYVIQFKNKYILILLTQNLNITLKVQDSLNQKSYYILTKCITYAYV